MSNTDVKEPVEKLSQETNVEEGMAAAGTDAVDESATESEREDARADEPEANTAGNDVISNDAPANAPAATTTGEQYRHGLRGPDCRSRTTGLSSRAQ